MLSDVNPSSCCLSITEKKLKKQKKKVKKKNEKKEEREERQMGHGKQVAPQLQRLPLLHQYGNRHLNLHPQQNQVGVLVLESPPPAEPGRCSCTRTPTTAETGRCACTRTPTPAETGRCACTRTPIPAEPGRCACTRTPNPSRTR